MTCDEWLRALETAKEEREADAEAERWADAADATGYLLTCLLEWGAPDPTPIGPRLAESCGLRFSAVMGARCRTTFKNMKAAERWLAIYTEITHVNITESVRYPNAPRKVVDEVCVEYYTPANREVQQHNPDEGEGWYGRHRIIDSAADIEPAWLYDDNNTHPQGN